MIFYKSDICRKEIADKSQRVMVEINRPWAMVFFCAKCAKPIIKFLQKLRLPEKQA